MNSIKHKGMVVFFLVCMGFVLALGVSIARASENQSASPRSLFALTPTPRRTDAFTFCAYEGGTCSVSDMHTVRYGAGTSFVFKTVLSTIACTAAAFGRDPAPGVTKDCRYIPMPITANEGWIACATEGKVCTIGGITPPGRLARYGAGTSYVYKAISSSIDCTAAAFGSDPAPGKAKDCLYFYFPRDSTAWKLCAQQDGGGCSFSSSVVKTVAYGYMQTNALYYKSTDFGLRCTNAAFGGDPFPVGAKSCYVAPVDFDSNGWVRCANQDGTCTFNGTKTVAFGVDPYGLVSVDSAFYYKNATGSVPCTVAEFGNPMPGVLKACYYINTGPG
jgi:hypothetical protein